MSSLTGIGLHVKNYKGFGEAGGTIQEIKRANIIIGRNNSGKSALLDIVQSACANGYVKNEHGHNTGQPELRFYIRADEQVLRTIFVEGQRNHPIPGDAWRQGGEKLVDRTFVGRLDGNTVQYESGSVDGEEFWHHPAMRQQFARVVTTQLSGLRQRHFLRISAERDVSPETEVSEPAIAPNGDGLTATIQHFLYRYNRDSELVEHHLLEALNKVFFPDARYARIMAKKLGDGRWEIYLQEEGGRQLALSACGSGLRTVLHVLSYLILAPSYQQKSGPDYVFAFEELENNLHPALQRRLLSYIVDWARKNDSIVFFTTHSNVVIDLFARESDVSMTRVFRDGRESFTQSVSDSGGGYALLDDLGVKASDLIQANGLVWVEGPSDRIYFNRWIQLVTGGSLKEGAHYQCVFYGGKLLSHLSAEAATDAPPDLVAALRVNRNNIIIMDSDRRDPGNDSADGGVNKTKLRIKSEMENTGGLAFVTGRREIENYLPHGFLKQYLNAAAPELRPFEDISEYLERNGKPADGKRFERSKVDFAVQAAEGLELKDIDAIPELRGFLDDAVAAIKKWNGLS